MNGLRKTAKSHGKWLIIITIVLLLNIIGFTLVWIYKDKKQNYSDLHRRVNELERICK